MEGDNINIKQLIIKILERWYLFILFPVAIVALAYLYILVTPRTYQASSLLLIKDEKEGTSINQESLFADFGFFSNQRNLENEQYFLKSSILMKEVVEELQLNYEYYEVGRFRKSFLYKNSPITVIDWQPNNKSEKASFAVEMSDSGNFKLITDEDQEFKGEFGIPVVLPQGKLTLSSLRKPSSNNPPIEIVLWPIPNLAGFLLSSLYVGPASLESSILYISLDDKSPRRAIDVLNKLMEVYNEFSLAEKNQVYLSSIDLINERVNSISDELMEAEQDVESYKRRFNMMELSSEGNMLIGEIADYNRNLAEVQLQLDILNSIEQFLVENQSNFEFVPTTLDINNLTLSNQINNFNDLLKERAVRRQSLGPAHPDLLSTERQIQNLRQTIIDNIKAIKSSFESELNLKQSEKSSIQSRIQSLPRRERELVEKERQKDIKENIYVYLLQKREESAISLAVSAPNGKVVEPAGSNFAPISPKRKFILTIAVLLGLILPSGLVFLLYLIDNKLKIDDDIEQLTSVPVAGIISEQKGKEKIVVKENQSSVISEMFKMLRANLIYIKSGEDVSPVIVTSSMSGEGKSFIASNIGVTIALSGKKTILVEMDYRRPVLAEYFQIDSQQPGIVNYLVNHDIKPEDIILPSGHHANLDIIVCGPIPPNPAELMLSSRLRDLINELKNQYEFILLDCPPVGMVSDPLAIADLASSTMFIAKLGTTRKSQLDIVEEVATKNKLPHPFLVLNGAKLNRSYYKYGYSNTAGGSKKYYS